MHRIRSGALQAILLITLAACSSGAASSPSAPSSAPASVPPRTGAGSVAPASLTIYAAASLKGALDKSKAAWETAYPGSRLTISTAATSRRLRWASKTRTSYSSVASRSVSTATVGSLGE